MSKLADSPPPPDTEDIAAFRRFNRFHTQFIGALDAELLKSGFSLIEARVLYELANNQELTARDIINSLAVDAGYLSRILSRFEQDGLLKRKASTADNRISELLLTPKGRASFVKLNALSNRQATDVLTPLSKLQRLDLAAAMSTTTAILAGGPSVGSVCTLRAPRPGDFGWVIHREAAIYAEEYGFDHTYEALVTKIVADFAADFDPKRERCWIAEVNGRNVGHIFLVAHKDRAKTARLRLLLVEPNARGLKVGTKLVDECIRFAQSAGYKCITLWTQKNLTAAHRIYQNAGFHLVEESPHNSFGQDLVAQTWEMDLN
jgi:DNA-binding MarR family transcriptional regulator/GNAT superfamily N-acetyltransferase